MHIGQHIKEVMRQQGTTATQLANDICCTRPHVHKIFRKDNIDIALLRRISDALNHDFFHDLSDDFQHELP
ncbi:MAG: helix-turn-helix transcriptional regulator [Bacteroidales bacterium]|nr:helix-turn-helix transcriptional regulator [Bacteroidales bacterium]